VSDTQDTNNSRKPFMVFSVIVVWALIPCLSMDRYKRFGGVQGVNIEHTNIDFFTAFITHGYDAIWTSL